MNTDTQRTINEIRRNGYYRSGTTLGEGGWAEVRKFASGWKYYELFLAGEPEPACAIHAQDDDTAVASLQNLFRLEGVEWEVDRVETTFTEVASSPK